MKKKNSHQCDVIYDFCLASFSLPVHLSMVNFRFYYAHIYFENAEKKPTASKVIGTMPFDGFHSICSFCCLLLVLINIKTESNSMFLLSSIQWSVSSQIGHDFYETVTIIQNFLIKQFKFCYKISKICVCFSLNLQILSNI